MRAIAAVSAALLIACTLLVDWHRATTMHGVCAEHGDELHLVQVDELRGAPDAHGHDPGDAGDPAEVTRSSFVPTDGDHHCQITATTTVRMPDVDDHPRAAPTAATDPHAIPAAAPLAARALFRLAPKTSPPVRA